MSHGSACVGPKDGSELLSSSRALRRLRSRDSALIPLPCVTRREALGPPSLVCGFLRRAFGGWRCRLAPWLNRSFLRHEVRLISAGAGAVDAGLRPDGAFEVSQRRALAAFGSFSAWAAGIPPGASGKA